MRSRQVLLEVPKNVEFEVLRHSNDWLLDYKGMTYSDKLKDKLSMGIFEEHAKKADIGYANIEKAMVFCIDRKTNEILSLGGSSLLREKKSDKLFESVLQSVLVKHRKIIPDLIMDNFGLWYASLFQAVGGPQNITTLTNDSGLTQTTYNYGYNSFPPWNYAGAFSVGTQIKMGSGLTAPARADHKIQTDLGNSPESGYLNTNTGAYTAFNTVIYQADANPTGGSGTVNEVGSFGDWYPDATKRVIMAHDAVSPAVTYTSGKLLRAAYTWQL